MNFLLTVVLFLTVNLLHASNYVTPVNEGDRLLYKLDISQDTCVAISLDVASVRVICEYVLLDYPTIKYFIKNQYFDDGDYFDTKFFIERKSGMPILVIEYVDYGSYGEDQAIKFFNEVKNHSLSTHRHLFIISAY